MDVTKEVKNILFVSNLDETVADQDFPEGAPTPKVCVLTYYFANFLPKIA